MIKSLFLCMVLCGVPFLLEAQVFEGEVLDAETQVPLPYTNIKVIGKNLGGISHLDGKFKIDLSAAKATDTVLVSYLGYEPRMIIVKEISGKTTHIISLEPNAYNLEPITVRGKVKTDIIGNNNVGGKYNGWGDMSSSKGRARGVLISNSLCDVRVKGFSFRLKHNDWDSVAFRLNLLSYVDSLPGESLLRQNIIIKTSKHNRWIKVDLESYDISICGSVILVLEWVDAWRSEESLDNLLTLSMSKTPGIIYSKDPGEDVGNLANTQYAPAMYLEVYSID